MEINKFSAFKNLKKHELFILAIATCLIAVNMTIAWRAKDVSQLTMSILFIFAICSIIKEKRHQLILRFDIFSILLGSILIAGFLWQSLSLEPNISKEDHSFILFTRLSPLICGIAIGLLASGWRRLKQYWQEITLLFFLGVPEVVLSKLIYIAPITAKYATMILWYTGFDVSRHKDIYITLATTLGAQTVKVDPGCSGVGLISYLIGISTLALVMFPVEKKKVIIVPIVASMLAFLFNGVRVAIMAVLASQEKAFDFWHTGGGSQIFGLIAVLAFALFYFLISKSQTRENEVSPES